MITTHEIKSRFILNLICDKNTEGGNGSRRMDACMEGMVDAPISDSKGRQNSILTPKRKLNQNHLQFLELRISDE